MYPHLELEENRRELERMRKLRHEIRQAELKARQQARSARPSLRSRVLQALRPSGPLRRTPAEDCA